MKKSVAVLGLGKYGKSLAENLYSLGADVLAVDCSAELVNDFAGKCTTAICANLSDEAEVEALGLKNMDIVVVAMSDDLASSVMSVAVAKEQGVPLVVAKSSSDRMSTLLKKVGADKIIDPEGEGGERSARIFLSSSFKDFFKIDDNMYMIVIKPKKEWIGKTLEELRLRRSLHLNVVAISEDGKPWSLIDPKAPVKENSSLLIVMEKQHMNMWK